MPAWAADSVWYQIFPLGYFDCAHANDHQGPTRSASEGLARLGDDDTLDHLVSLGVGVVLLNPIVESDTHGYDTADFFEVDRRLGTTEDFRAAVKKIHARGIRIVLDGVFNHVGRNHFAFRDVRDKGQSSKYCGWFHLDFSDGASSPFGDSFGYDAWEGHADLPRLNLDHPDVVRHCHDVARFWLSDVGVDGWRLDVAHEISPAFWRGFRAACLEAKPDMVLVGELIHGDYTAYVAEGVLCSGTNYQLSWPLWHSLVDRNYYELVHSLERSQNLYGGLKLLEFLGNHDTPRLASRLGDLAGRGGHELALGGLLLGTEGMPCLYYGDEYGMEGWGTKDGGEERDRDLRRPPPTDPTDEQRRRSDACAALLALRRRAPVFSRGAVTVASNSNEQMVLARSAGEDGTAIIAFNCAEEAQDGLPDYCSPIPGWLDGSYRGELAYAGGTRLDPVPRATVAGGKLKVEGGIPALSVIAFIKE